MSRTPKTDAFVAALRRRGVEVLTHDQWGSARRDLYVKRLTSHPHGLLPSRPVDTLWNHVTVTEDDGPTSGEFKADCREVERIGYARFGSGVSYNILVDRNAAQPRVAIGQFLEAKGTHTVNTKGIAGYSYNQNKVALALAWVGLPGDRLNAAAVEACVQVNAALIEVGAMTDHYDNVPHSLVAAKDCPTDELRDRLAEIKRRALMAARVTPPPPVARQPRRTPSEWNRFAHYLPYHEGNSLRAIDRAADEDFKRIDLDCHVSKDGVDVITHWDRPLRHKFIDPLRRTLLDRKVSSMSYLHLHRLRAGEDGYVIQSAAKAFRRAAKRGITVELEVKADRRFESISHMRRLKALADEAGCDVVVKTLSNIPGAAARLRAAKLAGFTTIILPRGTRRLRKDQYWGVADYVRGRVWWV